MTNPVLGAIRAYEPELVAIRQDIHRHPETGYEEVRTAALVAGLLRSYGLAVEERVGRTGVVGTLQGRRPGQRAIALRADMDALNITEATGLPYASVVPGKMHACGHDGHTAMLLGAARYLAANPDFAGTVQFIFQPAEEGGNGALAMVEDGLFDRFPADAVYGLHNAPAMPFGQFGTRHGAIFAAADSWTVTFRGTGGHGGSNPHHSTDPTIPLAHFILAVQGIIGRNISPAQTAVLSVGHISAGFRASPNIIPAEAVVCGTARSYDPDVRETLERRLGEVARAHAAASGCTAELEYRRGCPAVINAQEPVDTAKAAAVRLAGSDAVDPAIPPRTAGDDISFMFGQKPGAYMMIGAGPGPDGQTHGVHTPLYDFNDKLLALGAAYWVSVVQQELGVGAEAAP